MAGERSAAEAFLDTHPRLREHMRASERFRRIEAGERLVIDGQTHYVVRGDTLGGQEALYLDSVSRGASASAGDPEARALFAELDDDLKAVIRNRIKPRP